MNKFKQIFSTLVITAFATMGLSATPALAQTPAAPNSGAGSGMSFNWAGYTATGENFTTVSGSWVIPQASSSGNPSANAEWVGIGGVNSQDLIQVGTQTIFSNNQPNYQAWYELLPDSSQNINLTVKPGDSINASISQQSNGLWLIGITDASTGQSFQTTVNYSSSESSAEWIEEMPTAVGQGFIPLDNFGSVTFSNAMATENGQLTSLSNLGAGPMSMVTNGAQTLASPSAINSDGESFAVTRSSVTASAGGTGFGGFGRGDFYRQGRGEQGYQQSGGGYGMRRGMARRMSMFNTSGMRFFVITVR